MKRSLLVLALALPALALAAGWIAAGRSERASRLEAESLRASRALAAAREAVSGGLEALRAREDERPFYLYNHYYSPPEVLAISDPVAVSPLAAPPSDPRVLGWFQIEPDGTVRAPSRVAPLGHATRAERDSVPVPVSDSDSVPVPDSDSVSDSVSDSDSVLVSDSNTDTVDHLLRLARSPALDDLRALVAASEGALVVRATERIPPEPQARTRVARRSPPTPTAVEPTPPQQVTLSLNTIDNLLADEIRRAQAGDVVALERVTQRGRAAPITRRETTDLAAIQTQQAAFQSNAPRASLPTPSEPEAPRAEIAPRAEVAPRRRPRPRAPAPATDAEPSIALTPVEVDVQYTPMTWRDRGDTLALTRVVSHEGAAVAQVVALDRPRVDAWIDETIARATAGSDVSVHRAAPEESCLHEARADTFPSALRLCVASHALDTLHASLDAEARRELALSIALLALVALAVVASLRAIRREEELARARSDFVTAVSHELRTPLTTLRMHAEMLAEDLVPEARRAKVHHELVRETARLSRLVENVLETSRLEAGRRPLERVSTDVAALARSVIDGFAALTASRGATIHLDAPSDATFALDPDAFERILVNLIDNALKYGVTDAAHEVEVSVAQVSTPGAATSLELRVSDRGPGVAPSERERLFRRFARAPRADAAHRPGTGLGLALVRELARAHGGDARLEAREGGGSTVVVTLARA